jgi:alanyl-tRNA synthetase
MALGHLKATRIPAPKADPMEKAIDPAMHTAEHILNRTMVRLFGCGRAFSAHIEKKKSKCDYRFDRPLSKGDISRIEREVNARIEANLKVTETFMDRKAAEAAFDLARLPEAAGERIRVVSVGDYDACPCIGPHVAFSGDIGRFRITTTDFADGVLRVRFKLDRKRE